MSVPAVSPVEPPRLRRLAVPVTEPAAAHRIELPRGEPQPTPAQGRLTLTASSAPRVRPRTLLIDPSATPTGWTLGTGTGAAAGTDLPDPRAWVVTFVQAAVEVAAGARPAAQLLRWTAPEVQATLVRRAALSGRFDRSRSNRRRAVVRTVIVCLPAPGVCEASVVVTDRGWVRAVALRAEAPDGRWRVTALRIG